MSLTQGGGEKGVLVPVGVGLHVVALDLVGRRQQVDMHL